MLIEGEVVMAGKRSRRSEALVLTQEERKSILAGRAAREEYLREIEAKLPFSVIIDHRDVELPLLVIDFYERHFSYAPKELGDHYMQSLVEGMIHHIGQIFHGFEPVQDRKRYPLISKVLKKMDEDKKRKACEEERARNSWPIDPAH